MKSGKMRHGDKLVFLIKKFSTTAYEYKYNASCYLLISMLVWRDGGGERVYLVFREDKGEVA